MLGRLIQEREAIGGLHSFVLNRESAGLPEDFVADRSSCVFPRSAMDSERRSQCGRNC